MSRSQSKGFNATAFQVRTAYEKFYKKKLPDFTSYAEAGNQLVADMGHEEAKAYIQGQPNDPNTKE